MVAEIGGLNALQPMIVASQLGVPVLDCDGMGRAFPELQMFAPFMFGNPSSPAVIIGHHGNYVCCVKIESATGLESFFRQHCISMGYVTISATKNFESYIYTETYILRMCFTGLLSNLCRLVLSVFIL